MQITEIIAPIKLLKGNHADTGRTGSGCFMNVVSFLNGEAQITDESTCVCVTVRRIAIWFNDFLFDHERQEMLLYIERALGSATNDRAEMRRRLETIQARAVLEFARNQITWCDGDEHAVIAAIIARALELATPQLSDRNRAAIFWSAD